MDIRGVKAYTPAKMCLNHPEMGVLGVLEGGFMTTNNASRY
jgi:hypothetical protein